MLARRLALLSSRKAPLRFTTGRLDATQASPEFFSFSPKHPAPAELAAADAAQAESGKPWRLAGAALLVRGPTLTPLPTAWQKSRDAMHLRHALWARRELPRGFAPGTEMPRDIDLVGDGVKVEQSTDGGDAGDSATVRFQGGVQWHILGGGARIGAQG